MAAHIRISTAEAAEHCVDPCSSSIKAQQRVQKLVGNCTASRRGDSKPS